MAAHRRAMTERLTPEQLTEMSARRRAAFEKMIPEQIAELQRSRPSIPQ